MTGLAALRAAFTAAWKASPGMTCRGCRSFHDGPDALDAALPGLSSLSSSRASVTAGDGVCSRHRVYINGAQRCDDYDRTQRN